MHITNIRKQAVMRKNLHKVMNRSFESLRTMKKNIVFPINEIGNIAI